MKDQPKTSPAAPRLKRWAGSVLLAACAILAWVLFLLDPIVRLWRWWFGA